jgi:hypothetical protein
VTIALTCEGLLSGRGDLFHFLGRCDDCTAYAVAGASLERVEDWYHSGMIDQDAYEAYCWVWATSAVRFGNYEHWQTPPAVQSAREFAERIKLASTYRRDREAGRG